MDVAKPEGRGDISTSPSVHGSTGAPPLRVMMGGDDDSAPSSPPWPPSDAVSPVSALKKAPQALLAPGIGSRLRDDYATLPCKKL